MNRFQGFDWPQFKESADQEVAWWSDSSRHFITKYMTLPFRLWPIGVAATFTLIFFSFPWTLIEAEGSEVILPVVVAVVTAFLTCASIVLSGSVLAAILLHPFIGIGFWEGNVATGREIGAILSKTSSLMGRVAAAVLLTCPAAILLTADSSAAFTMTQVKQMGAIQLGLGIFMLSLVSIRWASEALWSLMFTVPQYSRFLLATLIPSGFVGFASTQFDDLTEFGMTQLLPSKFSGYTASEVANGIDGSVPDTNPWILMAMAMVIIAIPLARKTIALPPEAPSSPSRPTRGSSSHEPETLPRSTRRRPSEYSGPPNSHPSGRP